MFRSIDLRCDDIEYKNGPDLQMLYCFCAAAKLGLFVKF
jgi:hypothetical protein